MSAFIWAVAEPKYTGEANIIASASFILVYIGSRSSSIEHRSSFQQAIQALQGLMSKPASLINSVSRPSSAIDFRTCPVRTSVFPFFLRLPTIPIAFTLYLLRRCIQPVPYNISLDRVRDKVVNRQALGNSLSNFRGADIYFWFIQAY